MRHGESSFWEWFTDSGIEVANFTCEDLPAMRSWRAGYTDREIDFADATLVWLAVQRRTNLVATTDFSDFETCRLPDGKAFKLLLPRR